MRSTRRPTVNFGVMTSVRPLMFIKCCSVSSAARSHVNVSAKARAATPSDVNELARSGDAAHRGAHRAHVAVRHEKSRLAVAHRLANARRVRCDDRRGARGRLEVRDAPALLGRCEHERPRATQQRELLRLRDAPKKPHAARRGQASAPALRARDDSRPRRRSRAARSGTFISAKARMTRCTPLYFLSRPR